MATIKSFEKLEVWKESILLCTELYALTQKKEFDRDFGIKDQVRRAAVSISNNIAEGFEYNNNNYFLKYLKISKGSCGEIRNMVIILHEINYITLEEKKYFYDKSN